MKKTLAAMAATAILLVGTASPAHAANPRSCTNWHYADKTDKYVSVRVCAEVLVGLQSYGRSVIIAKTNSGGTSRKLTVAYSGIRWNNSCCATRPVYMRASGLRPVTYAIPSPGAGQVSIIGSWIPLVKTPGVYDEMSHGQISAYARTYRARSSNGILFQSYYLRW